MRHTAVLVQPGAPDAFGRPTDSTETEITRVCVQQSVDWARSVRSEESRDRGTLFFDARISTPEGLDLGALWQEQLDAHLPLRLTYGSTDYEIGEVHTYLTDTGDVHHWEATLR